MFQALGRGVYSLYMSLSRQLVVLLPMGWLLAKTGRLELVWWAFPIAEAVGLLVGFVYLFVVWKQILRPMIEEEKRNTEQ